MFDKNLAQCYSKAEKKFGGNDHYDDQSCHQQTDPAYFYQILSKHVSLHLPPVFASILIYASLSLNMSFLVVFPIDTRYNVGI